MDGRLKFLVVDLDLDGRTLLSRTLRRKFADAEIVQAEDAGDTLDRVERESFDAIIVHRPIGKGGLDTIREFRRLRPDVPIIMVSSIDRTEEALAAGANAFLLYDQWLMLGGVVADCVRARDSRNPWTKSAAGTQAPGLPHDANPL